MYYLCSVDGCNSVRQDVYLHRFPITNEKRLKKWLECLGGKFSGLSLDELKNHFVCHKHFERRFITSKNRLLAIAYPTLLLNEEIQLKENLIPNEEHNYSRKRHHIDHNYCKATTSGLQEICLNVQEQVPVISTEVFKEPVSSKLTLNEPRPSTSSGCKPKPFTTKKPARCRVMQKITNLSPQSKIIYDEFLKSKRKLSYIKRAKRAFKFSEEKMLEKITAGMNPIAKKLFRMQINLSTKKQKGRRFSAEEKLIALSIMKQSPKAYRFLHKIFILPSKTTLNKFISKLHIDVGINSQIFSVLKEQISTWEEKKKYCTIIFDEMSLTPALHFNKNNDSITGFVEMPERSNQFADHALVFLLRGAIPKWQQPIAYYFCEGATSGLQLKSILKDIVTAVTDAGLIPLALVCDQGSAFQSAIKSLKAETKRDQILSGTHLDDTTITINNVDLCVIYDPCHLIKGIRNIFLSKDIKFNGKVATWQDIVDVYKTDCNHAEIRLLHKLNDEHVMPDKIKKMKVKNCVRVLSKTMAAALNYTAQFSHYIDGKPVSKTLKNTAEIVSFFDELFDSVNGSAIFSKKSKGKELRVAVTEKTKHEAFWRDAIKKLETIKFIDKNGKEVSVPSLKNWVTTLKSFLKLWQTLKNRDIKIMRSRFFNSDPIENFFGQVRSYNFRNVNPNCYNFSCTFKSLLLTRFLNFHSETFNCEDDVAKDLLKLEKIFQNIENVQSNILPLPQHTSSNINMELENIEDAARRERLNVHSRAYTAGWVLKKVFNKIKICSTCKEALISSENESIHNWLSMREYKTAVARKLTYPSEKLVRAYSNIVLVTNRYLENHGHQKEITKNLKQSLYSKCPFDVVDCLTHKDSFINYFVEISIRLQIFNWCNIINKILMGTDNSRLMNKKLPQLQEKALLKYTKKLKNKSFNK